jgi:surface protein
VGERGASDDRRTSESEQAPPSLAEEREVPVFGEEVMVEEAAAEESMEAEALPMMMSEEPALLSETGEAEPTALPLDLTEEQKAALAAFDTMDADGDGELSAEEIHRALSGYDSASLERVQEIVSRADVDGNGLVSKQEYLDALAADIVPRGWLGTWLGRTASRLAAAFSGEAMPEAAEMVKYLTNEELRDWVKRWCAGDREGLPHISGWNTSQVTDMSYLFQSQGEFNDDVGAWDTSSVTNMMFLFAHAPSFNQPLNNWRVDKVTDMTAMFAYARAFNQPLNDWRVDNVTNMNGMFYRASSFNQPLSDWRVDNVRDMSWMFTGASSFNQPLNDWQIREGCNTENMYAGSAMDRRCCLVS